MNKKDNIINVARDLFTKFGYKKVSMDEIAKLANVTKKTIYSYFKDKESILSYFIQEELDAMRKKIDMISNSGDATERTAKSIYEILKMRKNSRLIERLNEEIKQSKTEECISFMKFYDDKIIDYIESKINIEINSGNIKNCDAHLCAFIIYKVFFSILFEYDREINEKEVTSKVIDILNNGILSREMKNDER